MAGRRTLHYVFKIGDRNETIRFFRDILGMKVLRHEEFKEGCKATCNGPYDGTWSKTMIGYGPEENHFVCELTYNYGIGEYEIGNDFKGITITSTEVIENCRKQNWEISKVGDNLFEIFAPGGYKFNIIDSPQPTTDPVSKVAIASSNLSKSIEYWKNIAGMNIFEQTDKQALLGYGDGQAKLNLIDVGGPVEHKKAFGRVAISCPSKQLPGIQASVKEIEGKILTELVSLDTPGKATVDVVILADPDDHEICFVGDEAFRELSQVDPEADKLMSEAIANDKSSEWYAKRNMSKPSA